MATTLQGIIADITYRNDDSGFTVARLSVGDPSSASVCVGLMPTLERGMSVMLHGTWEKHPKFGPQFSVAGYEIVRPRTREAMIALLGSGLIPHLGGSKAARIVDLFGESTLDVLDKFPERLLEVSGIGRKTLTKIKEAWDKQKNLTELLLFLQEFGVTLSMTAKIHQVYGNRAKEIISQNPFALMEDVWGVGFRRADAIAQKLGFAHDSYRRIRAGIVFVLQDALSNGHTYLPHDKVVSAASELLGVESEKVHFSVDSMTQARGIVCEEECLYLPQVHEAEVQVADLIRSRLSEKSTRNQDRATVAGWLTSYSIKSGWQGDPKQVEAVTMALTSPLFLLTGGPGTGKTTTLQVIVSYFRDHSIPLALAAPTGRAAQRMGSIAGISAQTIHRLLEFKPGKDGFSFSRNRENPLDSRVVILDEVSMVDIFLMRSLLSALRPDTTLILVGDANQLPSVGPGNVLGDLIASQRIPYINLTTVFRQAAQSAIIRSAHDIINNRVPHFTNSKDTDCFFMTEDDPEKGAALIVDLVASRLPKRFGFDPIADIQVLSPMHRGVLGTQNLNRMLQKVLNPSGDCLVRGETVFRRGDRVMQIKNNYDAGVFNGDIGYVVDIPDESQMVVDFEGKAIHYFVGSLDELVHAYCISIHKSQGCEFKAVIVPVTTQHYIMLQRNLVYTAITRARRLCVLTGSFRALSLAVNNHEGVKRYSRLRERIVERRTLL